MSTCLMVFPRFPQIWSQNRSCVQLSNWNAWRTWALPGATQSECCEIQAPWDWICVLKNYDLACFANTSYHTVRQLSNWITLSNSWGLSREKIPGKGTSKISPWGWTCRHAEMTPRMAVVSTKILHSIAIDLSLLHSGLTVERGRWSFHKHQNGPASILQFQQLFLNVKLIFQQTYISS